MGALLPGFSLLHMNPCNFQGQFYSKVPCSVEHEASTKPNQVVPMFSLSDMIASNSSVFWLQLCQVQLSSGISSPESCTQQSQTRVPCVSLCHLIPAWEWLPRMGSGSSFQLSQAVNAGQLLQCEVFTHKMLCFGRDQNMLIPCRNLGFPREEEI